MWFGIIYRMLGITVIFHFSSANFTDEFNYAYSCSRNALNHQFGFRRLVFFVGRTYARMMHTMSYWTWAKRDIFLRFSGISLLLRHAPYLFFGCGFFVGKRLLSETGFIFGCVEVCNAGLRTRSTESLAIRKKRICCIYIHLPFVNPCLGCTEYCVSWAQTRWTDSILRCHLHSWVHGWQSLELQTWVALTLFERACCWQALVCDKHSCWCRLDRQTDQQLRWLMCSLHLIRRNQCQPPLCWAALGATSDWLCYPQQWMRSASSQRPNKPR